MASDTAPPPAIEIAALHDVRAAHDAAAWTPEIFGEGDARSWTLARIAPAADSGAATVPGGAVDAATGDLRLPRGSSAVIAKRGAWSVLAASEASAGAGGAYAWTEPLLDDVRRLRPEDVYSPFVSGGVVLFAPGGGDSDEAFFAAPTLVFDGWAEAVAPALGMRLPPASALADDPAPASLAAGVARARSSGNPLVAVWAWRASLTLGEAPDVLGLAAVAGPARAVMARLLLDLGGAPGAAMVRLEIERAAGADELEPLAVGALSAALLPSPGASTAPARAALAAIAARRAAAPGSTGRVGLSARRLDAVLAIAGHEG